MSKWKVCNSTYANSHANRDKDTYGYTNAGSPPIAGILTEERISLLRESRMGEVQGIGSYLTRMCASLRMAERAAVLAAKRLLRVTADHREFPTH